MGQGSVKKVVSSLVIGASGKIGQSVSKYLALRSHQLFLHGGHNQESLKTLAESCRSHAKDVQTILLPFQNTTQFMKDFPQNIEPDILVVCFGPWRRASVEATTVADWTWLTDANLALPGALVSKYGAGMAKRGFGRIILFGSSSSDRIRPYTSIAAYAAAKTGLGVLAKSAAREWASKGVTCNVVCPGYVEGSSGISAEEIADSPLKIYQSPDNIAYIVDVLCQDKTIPVNGAIVSCGGGM